MLLSVFVALTLTPALCATLLKAPDREHAVRHGFFGWFNRRFDWSRDHYVTGVRGIIARSVRFFIVYAVIAAAVGLLFVKLPTSFVPNEDQGYFFVQGQTPPRPTQHRTRVVLDDVSQYLLTQETAAVDAAFIINGNNFSGRGQSQGMVYVHLKDWGQRTSKDQAIQAVIGRTTAHFAAYKDATIVAVNPPPIRGLGTSAGFDFELEDRGGAGHDALLQAKDEVPGAAGEGPRRRPGRFNTRAAKPPFAGHEH